MSDLIPLTNFDSYSVPGSEKNKISIKKYVESKGLKFKLGQGYYQLSKPEIIQINKTILIQRISDPTSLMTGSETIRTALNIDKTKAKNGRYMVDEEILREFRIYIQSSSYNRNLIGGTTFLYRKSPDEIPIIPVIPQSIVIPPVSKPIDDGPSPPKRGRKRGPVVAPAEIPVPPAPEPGVTEATPIVASAADSVPLPTGPKRSGYDKMEIVISFDTTGSMYPCLSTVRSVVRDTLQELIRRIPSIRIGILAHGDYADAGETYVTKAARDYKLCGASEISELVDFVTNVSSTCGYDAPECYELVLREVATKFDWSADANKSLILIGDATPHEPHNNPLTIDWRIEAQALKDKGIRVYTVQALDRSDSDFFYREVAQLTLGFHLRLYQFSSITSFLVAVCYREGDQVQDSQNLSQFEDELTSSGRMVSSLRRLFDQLQGRSAAVPDRVAAPVTVGGLRPVNPSRFQVLKVDRDMPIKQFAQARGLIFRAGRGFYEFTKPETISDKKEIILMDKVTEDFFTGWAAARDLAGIVPGSPKKQAPKNADKYIVFVQSTSYNRKLIKNQRFLYEVDSDC